MSTELKNFLNGEPLAYRGYDRRMHEATYQAGVGIIVTRGRKQICVARVMDDEGASRFWTNETAKLRAEGVE